MRHAITKAQLRRATLLYRRLLPEQEYAIRNEKMLEQLKHFLKESAQRTLHTFLPMRHNCEPAIDSLFPWLYENDFRLVVSKTHFKDKSMSHYALESSTKMTANEKGIPEPITASAADFSEVQLILVPLTLADKQGFRIGYGGGYYDRLLQETNATKIGLSLGSPVDKIVQRDSWDIPLNHLITPYKTYNYG